jgi:penicillin-binding protein 1A
LKRSDLAGKTGTTNDYNDAWFAGYQPKLVAVTWIGFDQPRRLGKDETGSQAALPIWMYYMGKALNGVPISERKPPEGVIALKINPETGLANSDGAMAEYFYNEATPKVERSPEPPPPPPAAIPEGARVFEPGRTIETNRQLF